MAPGTTRLSIGYTLLGLAVVYFLAVAPILGFGFNVSGGGSTCGGNFWGGGCESGGGSVGFYGLGWFALFPGLVLLVASIPLIITGHVARADAKRAATVAGVERAPPAGPPAR
ncbi:MAG: hypothetical protein ACYDCK_07690 [Thermoplasmatota archaeon]